MSFNDDDYDGKGINVCNVCSADFLDCTSALRYNKDDHQDHYKDDHYCDMDGHPSNVLIIRMVITVKTVIIIALSYDHYDDDDDAGDHCTVL